ncbi:MAG: dihydropteroate synthase [Candidatus Omnitrophota bacterium]
MGILNRTPDSFSDGGWYSDDETALDLIRRMSDEGADIIDVGGESTRPGSESVGAQEEIDRVVPIVEKAAQFLKIPVSVDTRKSSVAEAALRAGATIVNDVSGLNNDAAMAAVVKKNNAALIVMHMKGSPVMMQDRPAYDDLIGEVLESLNGSIRKAVEAGIERGNIIIDPGIGFGKTVQHNLEIINSLEALAELGCPIMIGVSRKSFIGKILDRDVDERLHGAIASSVMAVVRGANILRTHDVRQTREAVLMADAIMRQAA